MAIPSLRTLLNELDQATHAARTRRLVLLAREHVGQPKLATLLDGVSATSDYHARLVLTAAQASGDTARITGFLDHPNPRLRASALHVLPLAALSAEEFGAHYLAAPLVTRRMLLRKAAAARRTDLVDAIVQLRLSDAEIARLLAYASPEQAAARLSDLADLITNLARFAERHPDLLLDELARRLEATPAGRQEAWRWVEPALPILARLRAPWLLSLLVQRHDRFPRALRRSFRPLLAADPSAVAQLLASDLSPVLRDGWGVSRPALVKGLRRRITVLPADDVAELARRCRHQERHLIALLAALPPSRRAAVFTTAFAEDDLRARVWSDGMLATLPRALRQDEARRIAQLPEQRSVFDQLHWAQYWPVADATDLIERHSHSREATDRAQAWTTLLTCAANSGEVGAIEAALARLSRLTNEQDPVRCAAAQALGRVSPELISSIDIRALLDFAEAVAHAHDTSSATLASLRHTAWRLLAHCAARQLPFDDLLVMLAILAGPDGLTDVPAGLALPGASVPEVVAGLLPQLHTRAKRHDFRLLFSLWRGLGRHAWTQPDLLDLIAQALSAPSDLSQRQAAEAWLADPRTRDERAGELIARDETFVTLPVVQRALCAHRQDLLDLCYRPTPLKGRFWKKLRFVPLLPGPFTGWLPRQLSDYADALEALISSPRPTDRARPIDALIGGPKPTAHERAQAIGILGALPGIGSQRLGPYLASDDVVLVEAALMALVNGDDPCAGLATLLAHRGDDRARVALYAAGRSVRSCPPAAASALLVEVLLDPQAKITSRKQAARLIGTLRQPDAVDALSALGGAPVDVRIAAGSALRAFLDDDRAWYVLADLAVSGRDAELSLIQIRPEQIAVRHRPRYAQVLALAASGGDAVPIGLLGAWTPWSARLGEHLAALVSSPDVLISKAACVAVEVAAGLSADWTPYRTAVAALVAAAVGDDEPQAQLATDLPSWQRLGRLVEALIPARAGEAAYHREHLLELAHLFDEHPGLAAYGWRLRVAAIDWSAPQQALVELADQVDPLRAWEVATLLDSTLRRVSDQGHEPNLASAIEELAGRGDPTGGAVALALTVFAGTRSGWTPARRDQLCALRAHPVTAVAAWAHQHVTTVS